MGNEKTKKTRYIRVRVTPEEYQIIKKSAMLDFLTLSAYIRRCLLSEMHRNNFNQYESFVNNIKGLWDE